MMSVISFIIPQLYQKEPPTQVFPCEICDIFKNTYFEEHLRATAPAMAIMDLKFHLQENIITSSEIIWRIDKIKLQTEQVKSRNM